MWESESKFLRVPTECYALNNYEWRNLKIIINRQKYCAVIKIVRCYWASSFTVEEVKCTLVQALRLCTGRTAHRTSTGIALPSLDHDTRRWWRISVTPRPLFTPGKDPVPIVQEAVWAPGPVWTGAENPAPTEIQSPDYPARSQYLLLKSWGTYCQLTDLSCFLWNVEYRVIRKSLRDFRTRLRNNQDRHGRKEHINW